MHYINELELGRPGRRSHLWTQASRPDEPSRWQIMPKPLGHDPDPNLEIVGERLSKANEQFQMVEDLLNTSVGHHSHKFGLVNGCDPQGFRVTAVIRCQDSHLWEHYQHVKQNIVAEHENRLHASQGSAYLRDKPMKTPLLDAAANEYWFFHGT